MDTLPLQHSESAVVGGRAITPHTLRITQLADNFTGLPEGVSRYDLLDLVKRVGREKGFTPRLITHLEYLIRYTRDEDWQAGSRPIVYLNVTTMAQDNGVEERQINNLERKLNALGALTWRDSGNHRRHGTRDGSGRIVFAYGVDLSPLSELYDELYVCAQRLNARKVAWRKERQRISAYRKKALRLLEAALLCPDMIEDVETYQKQFTDLQERIPASWSLEELQDMTMILSGLCHDIENLLNLAYSKHDSLEEQCEKHVKSSDQSEKKFRHYNTIQPKISSKEDTGNPNVDKKLSCDNKSQQNIIASIKSAPNGADTGKKKQQRNNEINKDNYLQEKKIQTPSTGIEFITLTQIYMAASLTFRGMLPNEEPTNWVEFVEAAEKICPYLGINHSAWIEACITLGRNAAAVCVLIAEHRKDDVKNPVKNPGGFIRGCIKKAEIGELRLHQSIFGLLGKGNSYGY